MKISRYIIAVVFFSCNLVSFKQKALPKLNAIKISGYAQGTTYHITYYAEDSIVTKKQVDSILDKIDSSLSIYKPYSLINKFNDANSSIEMDQHLRVVVNRSLEIYHATEGIADITVNPLMSLWGFGPQKSLAQPDSAAVLRVMHCIGSDKIRIQKNRLVKNTPCVSIDVNGIAQGYSVDVLASFLSQAGVQNYIVELGGELRINGRKFPSGSMMRIGIEAPARNGLDEPEVETIVELDKGAITTSGNYRKYHAMNGKKISHLMNPKTGYPFQNELISVTVWANDAITADGYDNALMGIGLKKALEFLQRYTGMEAYFIYHNSKGIVSDTATAGFYKMIVN